MFTTVLINTLATGIVVLIHYEALSLLSVLMKEIKNKYTIFLGVCGILIIHTIEVWIFAFIYYYLHHHIDYGHLSGNFDGSLLDCVYFSFTIYTTLGFGDIEPIGHIKYLTGIQALIGFVLITWTASFLFIQMRKYWFIKE